MLDASSSESAKNVQKIVDDINNNGYACLPGFINPDDLHTMRSFVQISVQNAGGEYVGFTGPTAVVGSTLDTLGERSDFRKSWSRSTKEEQDGRRQILHFIRS